MNIRKAILMAAAAASLVLAVPGAAFAAAGSNSAPSRLTAHPAAVRQAVRTLHATSVLPTSITGITRWGDDATNFCLDSNEYGISYTGNCNGGNFQKWQAKSAGGINLIFVNRVTGECLDSNENGDDYTNPCNGGNFQKWYRK